MRSIEPVWRTQTRIGRARLVGLAGVLSTFVGIGLWAIFLLMLLLLDTLGRPLPHPSDWGKLPEALTTDALLALLALVGVLLSRWPLLSALVLLVASVGSIVWGFGWYMLLAGPSPLLPVGLGGILYLVAAIMMVHAALTPWDRRRAAN